jgi:hypothetical protein
MSFLKKLLGGDPKPTQAKPMPAPDDAREEVTAHGYSDVEIRFGHDSQATLERFCRDVRGRNKDGEPLFTTETIDRQLFCLYTHGAVTMFCSVSRNQRAIDPCTLLLFHGDLFGLPKEECETFFRTVRAPNIQRSPLWKAIYAGMVDMEDWLSHRDSFVAGKYKEFFNTSRKDKASEALMNANIERRLQGRPGSR